MGDEVTDELRGIYDKAYDKGIWLYEMFSGPDGIYWTAAGSISYVENLEKKIGKEIDVNELGLGDIFYLEHQLGEGNTREEACRNAIKEYEAYKKNRG